MEGVNKKGTLSLMSEGVYVGGSPRRTWERRASGADDGLAQVVVAVLLRGADGLVAGGVGGAGACLLAVHGAGHGISPMGFALRHFC